MKKIPRNLPKIIILELITCYMGLPDDQILFIKEWFGGNNRKSPKTHQRKWVSRGREMGPRRLVGAMRSWPTERTAHRQIPEKQECVHLLFRSLYQFSARPCIFLMNISTFSRMGPESLKLFFWCLSNGISPNSYPQTRSLTELWSYVPQTNKWCL